MVDLAIAPWAVRDFIIRDARGFDQSDVPGWSSWAEALEEHAAVRNTTSVCFLQHGANNLCFTER